MRFSARYVPAILVSLLGLVVSLSAQTTTKQTSKTLGGTVSGRVTIKDKGAAGVTVGLRKSENASPFEPFAKATTDHDGVYRITNVGPGNYEVMPAAPAFVMATTGLSKTKSVIVGADEDIEDINFSLVRGGVITGKVTDADGRPAIQQTVQLYKSDAFDKPTPQRPVFQSASAQTDDRGVYRMFGLAPGRYKVGTGRNDEMFTPSFSPNRTLYKQVFHPDVSDQTRATIIEVSEGSEANNVDITIGRALQIFSASGRVVDGEKGLPVPNIRFGLQRNLGPRFEFINSMATTNSQGDFVIEGLIPGKYSAFLYPGENSDLRVEGLAFDILDQDVGGLTIKLIKGASIAGIITLESEDKAAFDKLLQMQLRAYVMAPSGATGLGQSSQSSISPDGGFRLSGLQSGTVNIFLGSMMGMDMKGFTISRIERDGIVLPRNVEIKDGEQLTGVRIVVVHGNASLRGVVKLVNGPLSEGARIFVRLAKPGETSSMMMPPQVDARGHFLVEGLPPGIYEVTASIGGGKAGPPRPVKQEVTVQSSGVTEVMLTIDMAATPKP